MSQAAGLYATQELHMTSTDRIEKSVVLRAPRSKVWRALSDHRQFGTWFGAAIDQPFVAGTSVRGRVTTEPYTHIAFEMTIERIEPERQISFRWHPAAIEANVDYSAEPTTLVELTLDEVGGGTRLTVVESGFDRLPPERRATAFRMNDGGWAEQLGNIARHVETT
jgi:uncharacterized protein YndB with AHSA1/START domain